MRRIALLVIALLLAAPPAGALADDQLTIEPDGGVPRTLALSQLGEPDVVARPYTLPGAGAPAPITGYSLDRVLEAAEVDPDRFGSLSIQATSGTVVLSREEVTDTRIFPEGPPVFYVESGDARFLRPARANGEPAELAAGGPMVARIAAIGELSVSAKASPRRAKAGQPVRFTARVTGAEEGETVEVSWSFGAGSRKAGTEVTHRFRRPGTYDVTVEATRPDGAPGADAVVTVRVGRAPADPDSGGGDTNPGGSAPDSGGGVAPSSGSTGSTGGSGVAPVTPTAPSTPPSTYEPIDEPPQPPDSGSSQNPADDAGQPSDGLQSVDGIELADLNALSSEAGRDALEAARGEEDEPDEGVPDGVWWFLAIGGLLALGGLLELRRRPGGISAPAR
jgi:PKD domain